MLIVAIDIPLTTIPIQNGGFQMEQKPDVGYLIVNVSTARGAIPLSGATVAVMYDEEDNTSVFTVLVTGSNGKTEKIELPAPPRSLSETPGNSKPYATYTISVEKEGYYTVTDNSVPVFSGITSIQPVEMLPLAEYNSDKVYPRYGLDNTENENPNL